MEKKSAIKRLATCAAAMMTAFATFSTGTSGVNIRGWTFGNV